MRAFMLGEQKVQQPVALSAMKAFHLSKINPENTLSLVSLLSLSCPSYSSIPVCFERVDLQLKAGQ